MVEVAPAPGETVDADQDVLVTGIAPLEVDDPVEAVRPQSEEALLDHRHGFPFVLADSHPNVGRPDRPRAPTLIEDRAVITARNMSPSI
jgi:hypothetical protein